MFDSDDECMDTMGGFGKERNNNIAEAKKNGTAYEPEAPIHFIVWICVLEILLLCIEAISGYVDELHKDHLALTKDIIFFR